jgi:hypothetical protein
VSSYWAYYPQVRTEMNESHPRIGGPPWVRYRREAEDVLCAAGAAILHLPDSGLHCSLGQSFGSRDEQGFNLHTVSARRPATALQWPLREHCIRLACARSRR